ncbi:MAG: hypothetical protein HZB52_00735 [Chloroflexi bacterium]|nr:hypothetical protein [Chloroflexota bacterium]
MSNEGQSGGVNISGGTVNVSGDIVGRDKIVTITATQQAFVDWRKEMEKKIESQPVSEDDKKDLKETVAKIETEAKKIEEQTKKGEEPDTSRLEKFVNTLAVMGPEIFEVATTTLVNPLGGIGLVLKKIGEKAKLEKQAKK